MIWVRSSFCDANGCVEVATTERGVAVRSSLRPDEWLDFTAEEWKTFLAGARAGEFDRTPG